VKKIQSSSWSETGNRSLFDILTQEIVLLLRGEGMGREEKRPRDF